MGGIANAAGGDADISVEGVERKGEPGALEQVARLAGDWFLRYGESEQLEG